MTTYRVLQQWLMWQGLAQTSPQFGVPTLYFAQSHGKQIDKNSALINNFVIKTEMHRIPNQWKGSAAPNVSMAKTWHHPSTKTVFWTVWSKSNWQRLKACGASRRSQGASLPSIFVSWITEGQFKIYLRWWVMQHYILCHGLATFTEITFVNVHHAQMWWKFVNGTLVFLLYLTGHFTNKINRKYRLWYKISVPYPKPCLVENTGTHYSVFWQ